MVDRLGLQTTEHPEYTETNPLVKRFRVFRGKYLPCFRVSSLPCFLASVFSVYSVVSIFLASVYSVYSVVDILRSFRG